MFIPELNPKTLKLILAVVFALAGARLFEMPEAV
jgi:hypothetical protein